MGIRPSNWRQEIADCARQQLYLCDEERFTQDVILPLRERDLKTVNASIQRVYALRERLEALVARSPAVFQLHLAMRRTQEECYERIRDANEAYAARLALLTGHRPGIRTTLKAIAPYGQNRIIAEEVLDSLDDPDLPEIILEDLD